MITIHGSGFGDQSDLVQVSVIQSDSNEIVQECIVNSVSRQQIQCSTQGIRAPVDGTTYNLKIVVNEFEELVDQSITLAIKESLVESITPNYVSPVLETDLVVQLKEDYPHVLQASDFSAEIRL